MATDPHSDSQFKRIWRFLCSIFSTAYRKDSADPRKDPQYKEIWRTLYTRLSTAYQQDGGYPLVTLEEFFEGNNDVGSIGCNLLEHPGIDTFYRVLREIRGRGDVQDVLVGITDLNEFQTPEKTDEMAEWPFSDQVYIITRAPVATIESLLTVLEPDEVFPQDEIPAERDFPMLKEGYQVLVALWD